ncbi:MAG: HAD hydrolase family protein [Atopobiaceae bacterium]|nr:HAD hydrolase family protein [Atopobiaceae bacterium]
MPTIAFLDLDNTFWTEEGVPASALDAIRRAQANGHLIFSNTGRGRAGTRDLSPYGLDGRCYAAGSEAFLGSEKIIDEPLGIEASHMLCRMLDVGEGILIAEGGDRCYIRVYDQEMFDQLHEALERTNDPFIDHPDISIMTDEDHAQIFKYSLWIAGGVPDAIKQSLPEGYRETTMGDATEFTQIAHTKATALDAVRTALEERNGTAYRTMALGDSGNDIPMLRAADVGVCMGNGTDAAKAAADYVTSAITEDGLLRAFERFGLI